MAAYWLLFALFALGALITPAHPSNDRRRAPLLGFFTILMALMIGLRFEVGGDWEAYVDMFTFASRAPFDRTLRFGDPGYQLLNWAVSQLGGSVWEVNLICALIFCWGLLSLNRQQPEPWLAMVIAIPYLVIVVAMGYTRQAVAIGFLMAGLAAVGRGASTLKFAGYIALAALFHKTAVVALPLVVFGGKRNFVVNLLVGAAVTILFYNFFLERSAAAFLRNYVGTSYSSQGAAIRIALNVLPAVLYLIRQRHFGFDIRQKRIWRNFAYGGLALALILPLSPSSTAIDRLALYILPMQMVVLSRVPTAYRVPGIARFLIIAYSAAVLFVWLTFAKHSEFWLPYQIYPFFDS